jgi:hypothetical protein
MLQINPFLDCTLYSGIVVHIGRNNHYSMDCEYIQKETHERILSEYDEVRKMLISMINNSDKWCL